MFTARFSVMSRRSFFMILFFCIIPLVSSQPYISQALRIFNNSALVENMECDSRVDDNQCTRFTVYHLYAFAAKVPPSGAGGYITDEPQFACSHVEPPKNSTIEWAALVYYSSMSCDCSYEEKILHVQAAGYTIALLMETNNCINNIGDNDTNVIDITIPAVLLSQTVGLSLLSYSSPTGAKPTGSVIVEVLYDNIDYTEAVIVVFSCIGAFIFAAIACLCCCLCYRKCREKCKRGLRIRRRQYEILPEAKPKNLPKPSHDTGSETSELPELTSSQAGHVNIPLQKINRKKQHGNMYGTVSGSTTQTNGDALEPQLKLQVGDSQVDDNKN